MGFKPGISPNPSGRPKNSKNKTTEQFRALIKTFVEDNWKTIQSDFDKVKPVERLQFINNMIRHFLPEPLSLAKLSEDQLRELHEYLKKIYSNE
jgi:IS30 family transposase